WLVARLPDRRPEPRSGAAERAAAGTTRGHFRRMGGTVRGLYRRGASRRRPGEGLQPARPRRISARLVGGSHPAHEGGAVSPGARAFPSHRFRDRFQGACTMTSDVTLPTLRVLGSTMAYREAGSDGAPTALFLHGNP